MLAATALIFLPACDSGSSGSVPAIQTVSVGNEPVIFTPGEATPERSIRVLLDGSSDGLTANWTADGGTFSASGTASWSTDASESVLWSPDPLGGSYTINVTVTNGSNDVSGSASIPVEPMIGAHWIGTTDVTDGTADEAAYCMWVRQDNSIPVYNYAERTGSSGGSSGGNVMSSQYEYPSITLSFHTAGGPGVDDTDPISGEATVAPDGLGIEIEIELGSGSIRTIPLNRIAVGGTCDNLNDLLFD